MKINSEIKRARRSMGLSQGALARRLGVHTSLISHWELERRTPRRSNVQKLALEFPPLSVFLTMSEAQALLEKR